MEKAAAVEPPSKDHPSTSKSVKRIREEKLRRKDEKSLEHIFKSLDGFGNTEEKLGALCQKFAEIYNDHRGLQAAVKQAEKKNTILQKEKEQLQAEHSKAILTRSRLENLCRELQRQNKAVKEECMLKMREEGEKKREVAAKFHSMLSEIGTLLSQNNDKNAKLKEDNLDMSLRLKSVCDQFEKKEQHVENLAKQMQLEMQLADAKLAKAKMEMDIEKETLLKEKQALVIELAEYKRKLCEMKASELALREQISMYSDKYEEFHKALLQSNSAIGEFKAEMERMTKHIRRLEKETAMWMARYDGAQKTLTEMTQLKLQSDEALALSQRRLAALQGICRGLQDQCRILRGEQRRDSRSDDEFKKLEEQIREVEKSADLDAAPCPRKVQEARAASQTPPPPSVENEVPESNSSELVENKQAAETVNEDPGSSPDNKSKEEAGKTDETISESDRKPEESVKVNCDIKSDLLVTEGDSVDGKNEANAVEMLADSNESADQKKTSISSSLANSGIDLCSLEPDGDYIEHCVQSLVSQIEEITLLEEKTVAEILGEQDLKVEKNKKDINGEKTPTEPNGMNDFCALANHRPTFSNETVITDNNGSIHCNKLSPPKAETDNSSRNNSESDSGKIGCCSDEVNQIRKQKKRKHKK